MTATDGPFTSETYRTVQSQMWVKQLITVTWFLLPVTYQASIGRRRKVTKLS